MIRGNSVGLDASIELQRRTEKVAARESFRRSRHLFARLGTAEIAMDPMGPNVSDTYVFFKPRDQWREIDGRRATKAELVELMRANSSRPFPARPTCSPSQYSFVSTRSWPARAPTCR
jgi:cobalt-zinc-cadmium resistance protein CzcA